MYRFIGKRLFDLILTLPLLIAILPILGVTALLVSLKLGRPILFCAVRAGKEGRPFTLLKFRSMTNECDKEGDLLPDEVRLTRFGQMLRQFSLDELPQLLNVIRGDISLIGPRPLMERYVDRYSPEQKRRLEVRPGISGWAQVNGRNTISWEEKFKLDVWYVDNICFWLDVKILWRTAFAVITRQGISSDDHATMPEFMGSNEE